MQARKVLHFFLFLVMTALLLTCAGQIPPPGGPIDAIPPAIVKTVPDSNSVHVQSNSIELEFSEYVDRRTVEESIFISPYAGDLEFDWGTTDVRVNFSQQLKTNTTYVVNVGTDVVDMRAHNRMAAGYTLAFSTGDSIDQGIISGRVFDEKPEGVMIFAYSLERYNPDTLDPSKVKPDYIMQTGTNGLFTLSHIALGRYRVIAVRDEYHNMLYDKQVDQFGVTVGDTAVTYGKPRVSDLWLRLSQEDTSKPFLTSIQPLNSRHIRMRFSEAVDSLSFGNASFVVVDTLKLTPIPIVLSNLNRTTPTVVDLLTQTSLDSGVGYRVTARQIFDRSGNPIDSTNSSLAFAGVATPDTMRAVPTVLGIADSTRGIPLGQEFEVAFSEPVQHAPLDGGISFLDSARLHVPLTRRWLNATNILLVPSLPLKSKEWYQIRVVLDSVRGYAGNTWKDTAWAVRFQSLDLRFTGTVEGVVTDSGKERSRGPIFLTIVSADINPPKEKTIKLSKPGGFLVEQLPDGKYTFKAFRDEDGSGTYSFGRPFPFVPSERFVVSSDTVKVRARWGVEGVVLKFK